MDMVHHDFAIVPILLLVGFCIEVGLFDVRVI
jgi:hypothetical protein